MFRVQGSVLEGGVVAGQLSPPILESARCRPLSSPTGRPWAPSGGERNMNIALYYKGGWLRAGVLRCCGVWGNVFREGGGAVRRGEPCA